LAVFYPFSPGLPQGNKRLKNVSISVLPIHNRNHLLKSRWQPRRIGIAPASSPEGKMEKGKQAMGERPKPDNF